MKTCRIRHQHHLSGAPAYGAPSIAPALQAALFQEKQQIDARSKNLTQAFTLLSKLAEELGKQGIALGEPVRIILDEVRRLLASTGASAPVQPVMPNIPKPSPRPTYPPGATSVPPTSPAAAYGYGNQYAAKPAAQTYTPPAKPAYAAQQSYSQQAQSTYGQQAQSAYGQQAQSGYGQQAQAAYGQQAQAAYTPAQQQQYAQYYAQYQQAQQAQQSQAGYGSQYSATPQAQSTQSYGQQAQQSYGQQQQQSSAATQAAYNAYNAQYAAYYQQQGYPQVNISTLLCEFDA